MEIVKNDISLYIKKIIGGEVYICVGDASEYSTERVMSLSAMA